MPKTTTERELPPFHHPLNLRVLREDYDRLPGGMLKFPRTRESLRESSRLFQYYSSRSELFSRCARDIGTRTASVGRNIFFLIIFFFFGIRTIWNFVSVYYNKIVKEDRFYTGGWLILLHCNCFTREKNKTLKSFMHFV